ncbi:MAG: RNA-binding S4 domain-containing protein [Clostridia bacterium]|nr:RNA-binding S4 domain-containing protein [Clostridia bacterium]MBR7160761.1 RNA-binding S4 domain-containing protein [Clostridia bacterium]
MRVDKFLKVSRVIKRRTVAKDACEACRVSINGRTAKPSSEVNEGDILTVRFGIKEIVLRVLSTKEYCRKEDVDMMYEILEEDGNEVL